jgi:peroxin-16
VAKRSFARDYQVRSVTGTAGPPANDRLLRAVLRIILLRVTRRPLLCPPIPEREFDPSTLPAPTETPSPTIAPSSVSSSPPATPSHLQNNRVPLPPHPLLTSPPNPAETAEDYLLPKALTTSSVKPSHSLLKPLSSYRDWLAEVLYILRPLAYGKSALTCPLTREFIPSHSFAIGV